MTIEALAATAASATVVIGAIYEVAIRGGRHTRRIMRAVETIETHSAELLPNHGSSLRDQVDKIAAEQNRHSAVLADHTEVLGDVQRTLARVAVVLAERGTLPARTDP
jgi:TPP-dependent trihydroxycyclohexane-1,2-dione (THcHDO) dehydratase